MTMDVREKLVELLQSAPADIMGNIGVGVLADHLISNGVTVQSERMVDAVPVSELKELRDYLYKEDLIFMRGLAEINKLIANYCADGKRKENE